MAEYYAVERSPEYLAHYGVRGMRWGVRRAIKSGNSDKLSKAYHKAAIHLGKLSMKANQGMMKKSYQNAKQRMLAGAASSAALSGGLTAAINTHLPLKKNLMYAGGAALAGGTAGALLNSKGILSGRYVSDKGHKRALEKRNRFRKEMENEFKNTRYGGKEQKRFHQQIMSISDQTDPIGYLKRQQAKVGREYRSSAKKRK